MMSCNSKEGMEESIVVRVERIYDVMYFSPAFRP